MMVFNLIEVANITSDNIKKIMLKFGYKIREIKSSDYVRWYNDDIIIWTKQEIIENLWFDFGNYSVTKYEKYKINQEVINKIFETHTKYISSNKMFGPCSRCKNEKEIFGRHFAGKYCAFCWANYKKENSRVCLICRRPLYECTC